MMSDMNNLDVILGNGDNNPTERELADAIEQSSVQGTLRPICTRGMIIEVSPAKMIHLDKTMSSSRDLFK